MKRTTTIVLALLLAASMVAMPLAAADVGGAASVQEDSEEDTDDERVAPGEQLSGVVGVQEAEFDGEVAERTYGISVAKAATDDAKADVVGEQLADIEERIEELEARSDALNESYEAGEITQGQYEARMASVATEKMTAERLANGTAATAGELDEELREERGINLDAIRTLADRAADIGGPGVAEIGKSIAGPSVGQPVDSDREPGAPIDRPGSGGADDADGSDDADDADDSTDDETDGETDDRGQNYAGSR